MSHHRRARHVWGVAVCIAVLIATTGCRRSPFHRHGEDRPTGPDGKPIGYQEPQSQLDQASAKKPSVAKPAAAIPTVAVATTATRPAPSPPPDDAQPIAPAATPMLDAALKRAEAIETEHRRIMREELTPKPEVKPVSLPNLARKPESDDGSKPDEAVQRAAAAVEAPAVDKTKLLNACAELVELLPSDLSAAAVPAALPRAVALLAPTSPPTAEGDSETEAKAAPAPAPPSFGINAVQICRRIHGFGSFETMDPQTLRVGRPVLIYSELSGLRYDLRDEEYVSHVATHVELIAADGSKVWEVDGDAEDRCRRLRRDSFVGTQVNLPASIPPGPYTIRLAQTDDLAQRTATAELAVTIGP